MWALGSNISVRAFYLLKYLFKQVGSILKTPKNWDEMLYYAKCITDPSHNRYGINLSRGIQRDWDFISFLWSSGGGIVWKNKDGRWQASFGTRAAAEALEFYMRLETERWIDSAGVVQHGYRVSTADTSSFSQALPAGKIRICMEYLGDKDIGGGRSVAYQNNIFSCGVYRQECD